MGHLLAGDQVADFAGVGLYRNRVRFDRHRFRRGAYCHLKVDTKAVADRQGDILLFDDFETGCIGFDAVVADRQIWRHVLARFVGCEGFHGAG